MTDARGLTLIEVLVAMLVLATAVASALALVSIHTSNTVALEEQILARIVAENVMVETTLQAPGGSQTAAAGTMDMGGMSFSWTVVRSPTTYPGLELVHVEVANDASGRVAADLRTLAGQP